MRQNIYNDETFFAGYRDLREKPDTYNDLIEQPAMRAMLPPLTGATVLDLGCGFGDLSAHCVAQGAERVVAEDISEKMLALGRERNSSAKIERLCMAMEDLTFAPETFDVIVSSLALHWVADYAGVVRNVARWLKPGGVFAYSVEHPISTARRTAEGWICYEAGRKLHWPVDDYQDEGIRQFNWFVEGVVKYHRTLATLLTSLMQSGLTVTDVCEPAADRATIARLPYYEATRRFPPFLVIRSDKKEA